MRAGGGHAAELPHRRKSRNYSVSNKNDARSSALEALHGVVEGHRPTLQAAFAERGSMSLLPTALRAAISEIMVASRKCSAAQHSDRGLNGPGKENPLLVTEEGRGRID
jgi:hypothetical protein